MSKLTFLGTAGDSFVMGKQDRFSGGIILEVEDLQFHIDPGPGSIVRMGSLGLSLRATSVVLVSSTALLASHDVNAVVDAFTYGGFDKRGIVLGSSSLFDQKVLALRYQNLLEKVLVAKPGGHVGISAMDIEVFGLKDEDPDAVGFKLYIPDFTLGYIPRTRYFPSLSKICKGCDVLIVHLVAPLGNLLDKKDVIDLFSSVKPKLGLLSGFGIDMLKADPLLVAREIQKASNVQTIAAKDGLSLVPGSFIASSSQKRLGAFTNL